MEGLGHAEAHRKGKFRLWAERDGVLLWDTGYFDNGYPNSGKAATAKKMCGSEAVADFDYLAVGSQSTPFDATQTALVTEITADGLERAQDASPTTTTTTVTDDTSVVSYSWSVTGPHIVREVACFNAPTDGDMIGRSVVNPSEIVDAGDTLNGSYTVAWS